MGKFLNPDNSAFQTAINSQIYIDKTGLIAFTNSVLGTQQAFICNSRPRRFGKSLMLSTLAVFLEMDYANPDNTERTRKLFVGTGRT